MRAIQYTPWIACSSGCPFCTNRGQPDIPDRAKSLALIIKSIQAGEADDYDTIGLIGGEFFQHQLDNPRVHSLFYLLLTQILWISQKRLWLATSLICKSERVFECLRYIEAMEKLGSTLLCTSYDPVYRFKNDQAHSLWHQNMMTIRQAFPDLGLHVEIIVTQGLIQAMLAGTLEVHDFERRYGCTVDFIEPHSGFQNYELMKEELPLFFPERHLFLEFLNTVVGSWEPDRIDRFLNPRIRSDTIYHIQQGKVVRIDDRWNKRLEDQAQGIRPHVGYSDSTASMITDVEQWKENR